MMFVLQQRNNENPLSYFSFLSYKTTNSKIFLCILSAYFLFRNGTRLMKIIRESHTKNARVKISPKESTETNSG